MVALGLTRLNLPPDVFAVVMATGIVSVAAQDHHYPRISVPLAGLAVIAFVVLALGLVLRVAARPGSARVELADPDVALRLFTVVSACAVLAARFAARTVVVGLLGAVAVAAWLLLVPVAVRDVRTRPRTELRDHAHGAWLLPSVATSGLAGVAADLAIHVRTRALLVVAAVALLLALGIYLAVVWLIVWRAVAAPFGPDEVTPDSWILMGALAIAALAGDQLSAAATALSSSGYRDWVPAVTAGTWAVASLWVPLLLYAELWRVDQRAGSVHYARVWWSAVFPVGMYSAASAGTAVGLRLSALTTVSLVFFWIALTMWLLVAVGLVHRFVAPAHFRPG